MKTVVLCCVIAALSACSPNDDDLIETADMTESADTLDEAGFDDPEMRQLGGNSASTRATERRYGNPDNEGSMRNSANPDSTDGYDTPQSPKDALRAEALSYMAARCDMIRSEAFVRQCHSGVPSSVSQCMQFAGGSEESMHNCLDQYLDGYNPDD